MTNNDLYFLKHPKYTLVTSWCLEVSPVAAHFLTETPILWPPDAKSCLIRKDPDAGKDRGQEEKEMTEDPRLLPGTLGNFPGCL